MVQNPNNPDLDALVHWGLIRLEITGGIPTWEASPGMLHQMTITDIQATIKPLPGSECECSHWRNVTIGFPDGSIKEPDISIFCEKPPLTNELLKRVPQAIIEILNPGYEFKDLWLNPYFYLSQGVGDVVIVDPNFGGVTHYRTSGVVRMRAPVRIELGCGSTIPFIESEA